MPASSARARCTATRCATASCATWRSTAAWPEAAIRRVALALAGLTLAACGGAPETTLRDRAGAFHEQLRPGDPVGQLLAPRLRASVVVRAGFTQADIDRGPGWFPGSRLPGEGGVTYIAGHRLSHGAPFRWVGRLRVGDRVILRLSYADAAYVVARRAYVDRSRRSVLTGSGRDELRLQTSTVPAGDRRLVVFARASALRPRAGRSTAARR